ncbi:MAG: segregation/condensation protein A [Patescibacteria group bacterium]|nr:segregation/condensation protein A [Patescibacteria group bacterium]
MSYQTKISNFEGPLGLLLSLIEAKKLHINEVSLTQVTDDYVNYVRNTLPSEKKIANISYFLLIATTLLLIKSKSLLPNLDLTDNENQSISNLELRLKLYKLIKNAGVEIKKNFGMEIIFFPEDRNYTGIVFSPDPQLNINSISSVAKEMIRGFPEEKLNIPEIEVTKVINISEIIDSLIDRMQQAVFLSFNEFSKSHQFSNEKEAKINIIVSFLAMLELVREGTIDVVQENTYEDMMINKQ